MADVRKGSRVMSLKRIDERVDRDLAKNHVLAWFTINDNFYYVIFLYSINLFLLHKFLQI